MKNFEYYKNKIEELNYDFALVDNKVVKCDHQCNSCSFQSEYSACSNGYLKTKWLYDDFSQPKFKMSKETKAFLEAIKNCHGDFRTCFKDKTFNDGYEYVGSTFYDVLTFYKKGETGNFEKGATFNLLFDFPYSDELVEVDFAFLEDEIVSLEEILENAEVV